MRCCGHGNHRRTVSPHRAVFADTTRPRAVWPSSCSTGVRGVQTVAAESRHSSSTRPKVVVLPSPGVGVQMRGMGILPNDQLVDSNGQPIRDLNAANSFLQANANLRVRRNGQIVTIQQAKPQSSSTTSQLGWSFGTRNNSVFISSLVSNSLAAQAGLRAGDQIVSINGNAIGRPEDISTYMLQANSSPMTISYLRNGQYGEAFLNSSSQIDNSRQAPQSLQSKLDLIERLIGEIRAELSLSR